MDERKIRCLSKYQRKLHHFYTVKKVDGWYETNRADYWVEVIRGYRSDWRGVLNIVRRAQRGIPITVPSQYKELGIF